MFGERIPDPAIQAPDSEMITFWPERGSLLVNRLLVGDIGSIDDPIVMETLLQQRPVNVSLRFDSSEVGLYRRIVW